jgi:large subunit ribosomal protein L25
MEIVALNVEARSERGKGPARRARMQGRFPAVFYGPKIGEARLLSVGEREFVKKVSSLEGAHLIRLDSEASELNQKMVLLREVQSHPVTGRILHADLYEVDLDQPIEVTVAIHFVGKAAGVERGGILQPIVREILIHCLPTNIPEFVEVDVSNLDIHDSVHIEDVPLPAGVTITGETNYTLVTVVPPTVEQEPVEAEAEAEGEGEGEAKAAEESKSADDAKEGE